MNRRISSHDIQTKSQNIENKVIDEFRKLEQVHTRLRVNNRLIEQNILLLGPTQSGKTTLTQVLENPCHRPDHLALRGTPNQTVKLRRIECGVSTLLQLNIVEIPGEMLGKERDLSKIDEACVRMGVTQFHLACFCVSVENGILEEDTRLFERLINHFGAAKIQSNLSLILTRCESKDNEWRELIKNEINKDSRFTRLIQRFGRGTHFTGALNPTYWDRANEEVILDQFQTIYHDRQAFLQSIERECNAKPFIIQERKIGSTHENSPKNSPVRPDDDWKRNATFLSILIGAIVCGLLGMIIYHRLSPGTTSPEPPKDETNGGDDATNSPISKVAPPPASNTPWPKPRYLNASNDLIYINPQYLKVHSNLEHCDIIKAAIQRHKNIFHSTISASSLQNTSDENQTLTSLYIQITAETCEIYPTFDSDESYNIIITNSTGKIEANTVWGALNGLETFSQLPFVTVDKQLAINASLTIEDSPRFPYRGMLLDTSHHFLPVALIKKHLDAMAYNKLNVLHWRIVGDEYWPLVSVKFPTLSEKGAFSSDHVYTPDSVSNIIEYARLRGIHIIPEFNVPGHIAALGRAFPEYLTDRYNELTLQQGIPDTHAEPRMLNPAKIDMYEFMKTLLQEVHKTFKHESYIHLGMDKVYPTCLTLNSNTQKSKKDVEKHSCIDYTTDYSKKTLQTLHDLGVTPMLWQDVLDHDIELPTSTIIEIWRETQSWSSYLSKATTEGYNVVLAAPFNLSRISYGEHNISDPDMRREFFDWYNIDLFANFTGDEDARKRLLGGEATLSEKNVDATNSLKRFWPRASIVAEQLWSLTEQNNTQDALFRFYLHLDRSPMLELMEH